MKIFLVMILTLSCFIANASSIPFEKVEKLKSLRTSIRSWAKICPDGTMTDDGSCPNGDMTIFAGLLCLSGEKDRCLDVKGSQRESGEWFRNHLMKEEGNPNGGSTFSRDQSRGVLAYLVATQDKEAASKWMDFIEENDWKLCQKSEHGWDACAIRPTWWLETTRVWDFLGLKRRGKMRNSSWLFDHLYRPIEASHQPEDYPMHLTATGLYIRQEIEKRTGAPDSNQKDMNKVIDILYKRWPYNPFMSYLKFGPNEEAADTVLKYCPALRPDTHDGEIAMQWIWQRAITDKVDGREELSWNFPSGHDCIFMINVLIGNSSAE